MIPDHLKEQIKAAADIVEVVGETVKLRRSGSNWQGLCPFHNEKSPSFNVSPALGIYKCFGCGETGDVFSFLMKTEGLTFVESMKRLAERYNITLPETPEQEPTPEMREREAILHALRFAGRFWYRQLADLPEAEEARAYLKKRGFTGETVKTWGLGYAPDRYDALLNAAHAEGITDEALIGAGLCRQDDNGTRMWDVFRGRLMFPIFNAAGSVIGYGGRVLREKDASGKTLAKYVNTAQTLVYNKSEVLYGIHAARQDMRKFKEALLVEGYTDVIQLHQAGIRQAVATSGTALTAEQLRLLHRYAERLLMIYDADSAGQNAMDRALDLALAEGLQVKLLHLPDGEDPDSFVRQFGGKAFVNHVKDHAKDFVTFLVEKARDEGAWDDPDQRRTRIDRILKSISVIGDAVTRENMVQHLSQVSKVGDRALFESLNRIMGLNRQAVRRAEVRAARPEPGAAPAPTPAVAKKRPPPAYEAELIRLMIRHGAAMVEFVGSHINADHFEDEALKALFHDLIERFGAGDPIAPKVYLDSASPFSTVASGLLMPRHEPSAGHARVLGKTLSADGEDPYLSVRGELKAIKLHYLDRLREKFRRDLDQADDEATRKKLMQLLQKVTRQYTELQTTRAEELFA